MDPFMLLAAQLTIEQGVRSALPDAPVVAHSVRAARLRMTAAAGLAAAGDGLRRLAAYVEPAPRTVPSPDAACLP